MFLRLIKVLRYQESYFETWPGVWLHGDWLKMIARKEMVTGVVFGRSDSTINRYGLRMGTSEIYRVVEAFPEVLDSLDAFPESLYPDSTDVQFKEFAVSDTVDMEITLPRIVRFSGSAWANRILQLDLSATLPVTGDFAAPLTVDLGTTWRFSRTIPIRLGMVFGGDQGVGYTGGIAVEGRNFLMRFAGGSLGGFIKNATGLAGRFEWGFFF